ncbi:MAG: YdeI/OmpD-associated family protein [Myxococcales bacterium]|nr:YdeI/OmpD-associated family protein [Myxococcales bacterium]
MEITTVFDPETRRAWRDWLAANHAGATEIWMLLRRGTPGSITYLDAVEEALCFGWIDGIAKSFEGATAQRFTPRRPRSNWTELNKSRARRLIDAGKMTEAGRRTLPDLSDVDVRIAADIRARLEATPPAWQQFQAFPSLYQRVRLGYIEEVRKRDPAEWERRLANFVAKTAKNELFGNWDDSGLPRTAE